MMAPLPAELEARAQELASRIQQKSAEVVLAMARQLVATTDATLFGETEFLMRDQAMKLVGTAYTELLEEKKTAITEPAATVRTAKRRQVSTITEDEK